MYMYDLIGILKNKYQLVQDKNGQIVLPDDEMYEKVFNTLDKYMEQDEKESAVKGMEVISVYVDDSNRYTLIGNFDNDKYILQVEKNEYQKAKNEE